MAFIDYKVEMWVRVTVDDTKEKEILSAIKNNIIHPHYLLNDKRFSSTIISYEDLTETRSVLDNEIQYYSTMNRRNQPQLIWKNNVKKERTTVNN
jgi:hypothetical protein